MMSILYVIVKFYFFQFKFETRHFYEFSLNDKIKHPKEKSITFVVQ